MELAVGLGSLVLLAGGTTALVRRSMAPGQALGVLVIAVVTAAITYLAESVAHDRGLGTVYVALLVGSMTLAGILTAVAVVLRRL